ncbi:MAG: copper-binding protein [Betaproteobacteria bacterium]|nr:copper-binding protein [Betaproteobacteria bacterium]
MKHASTLVVAIAMSLLPAAAFADGDQGHGKKPAADTKTAAEKGLMAVGEVKKVDKEAGKVTIKHGEIKNLDMPAMTMVFRVKEAAMLDQLKTGDKIQFAADKIDGNFTVTKVEIAK